MQIVLATKNRHKVDEISKMLKGFKITSLLDFPQIKDIPETGNTFFDNALIKARAIHKLLGKAVLADDSGLCVDVLDGEPGVKSARYAGSKGTQKQIISKLLRNMKGKKERKAYFMTVMVYLDDKGKIHRSTGKVHGLITEKPSGTEGFGYDPVFYYRPLKKTFAELSMEEKSKISHRSRALAGILPKIRENGNKNGSN